MFGFFIGLGTGYLLWAAPKKQRLNDNPKNPRRVVAGKRVERRMLRDAEGRYVTYARR